MTMNILELPNPGKAQTHAGSRSIGSILIDAGRLSAEKTESILRLQNELSLRFGDAAIELGLLDKSDIHFALSRQFDYPCLPADDDSLSHELVAAYQPHSPTVERLRALRNQLILRQFDGASKKRHSLAIVSPGKGEGRSFLAANLAIVFSQLGERTLLIDADLRDPRQHDLFKISNVGGLSGLLAGRTSDAAVVVRIPSLPGLFVLPAGAVPPNPLELLGRPAFGELLRTLGRDFDVLIIDTPPASDYSDAQTIAVRAGSALVVGRENASLAADVAILADSLRQSGAQLVGAVLNEA
jgi:chain length determinant protein tyrosine kinase EpsG